MKVLGMVVACLLGLGAACSKATFIEGGDGISVAREADKTTISLQATSLDTLAQNEGLRTAVADALASDAAFQEAAMGPPGPQGMQGEDGGQGIPGMNGMDGLSGEQTPAFINLVDRVETVETQLMQFPMGGIPDVTEQSGVVRIGDIQICHGSHSGNVAATIATEFTNVPLPAGCTFADETYQVVASPTSNYGNLNQSIGHAIANTATSFDIEYVAASAPSSGGTVSSNFIAMGRWR